MTSREEVGDAEFKALCNVQQYSTLNPFIKLFKSLSDPQTATVSSRHLALARNVVYQNEIGWKIESFQPLNKFFQLLRDKISDDQLEFLPILHDAIELCCKPFLRSRSNEELAASEMIGELLRTLSQLLVFRNEKTQKFILEFLLRFNKGECLCPIPSKLTANARSFIEAKETGSGANACNMTNSTFRKNQESIRRLQRHCQSVMRESNVLQSIVQFFEALISCDPVFETSLHPGSLMKSKSLGNELITNCASSDQVRNTEILYALLNLISEISTHSPSADDFVALGGVRCLVMVLDTIKSPRHEYLYPLFSTFWSLLQSKKVQLESKKTYSSRKELLICYRKQNAMYVLADETSVAAFMRILVMLVQHGSRNQEKRLRNDYMIVIYVLSQRHRATKCYQRVGLTSWLLSCATAMEGASISSMDGNPNQTDVRNYTTTTEEDFEFKCLLWRLIAHTACINGEVKNEVIEFRFVEVMLQYVKTRFDEFEPKKQKNIRKRKLGMPSLQQYETLRILAIDILSMWSSTLQVHFTEIGGQRVLLGLIENNTIAREMIDAVWKLFSQYVCSSSNVALQDEMGSLKAVELCVEAMDLSSSSDTIISALVVASEVCRKHVVNRNQYRVANGVHQILMILEHECVRFRVENGLFKAAIHAVRSCVVGDAMSELIFLGEDGVARILDAMCVSSNALRNQILGVLVELAVNPAFLPSFISWRSSKDHGRTLNAFQLLLQMVGDVKYAKVCIEVDTPSGEDATTQSDSELDGNHSSQAINVLSRSFSSLDQRGRSQRPSSAAFTRLEQALEAAQVHEELDQTVNYEQGCHIDSLLDSHFVPSTKPFKEEFDVFTTRISTIFSLISPEALDACTLELSVHERLLLESVKEYVTLQNAKMWHRVHDTLHHIQIRPIYADAIHIQKQIESGKSTAINVRRAQRSIIAQAKASEMEEMEQFYDKIRRHRNQNIQAQYHQSTSPGSRRKLRSMDVPS